MRGMGYNVGLLHVDETGVEDLARIGLVPTGEVVTANVAMTGHGVAALATDRGVLVLDPGFLLAAEDERIVSALGQRVVAAAVGSTGDTFDVLVREPGGLVRHRVDSQGERPVDEGAPLPGESAEMLDDLGAIALFDTAAGTAVGSGDFLVRQCQVLAPSGTPLASTPAAPERPRQADKPSGGGFFSRLFGRS